jgi:hypothetical protein
MYFQGLQREAVSEIEVALGADPDHARFDPFMGEFPDLDVGKGAHDAVVQGCQVHGGKGSQKGPFHGGTVDVGVMSGKGVLDTKFFQVFRVVGEVVHKGFDQETVLDDYLFIVVQGDAEAFVIKMGSLALEFVAPDVGLVDERVLCRASSQKIAPG